MREKETDCFEHERSHDCWVYIPGGGVFLVLAPFYFINAHCHEEHSDCSQDTSDIHQINYRTLPTLPRRGGVGEVFPPWDPWAELSNPVTT
ncbi:hypothetical protein AOXY_G25070 [Acipenser oxyrinchus oxyrinchus]|uniref:Uncharacterized protein n=1 Tax=Acipenser oxyrinchus oxyrinchus TaxID=40147 RepID=A0AAD8FXE2_ACIOX|nr:hypothetical protein AOXY_G25070 [Acipenser oxyrinchus oxyrinchus]